LDARRELIEVDELHSDCGDSARHLASCDGKITSGDFVCISIKRGVKLEQENFRGHENRADYETDYKCTPQNNE